MKIVLAYTSLFCFVYNFYCINHFMIDILYFGLDERDYVKYFYRHFYYKYISSTTKFNNELSKENIGSGFSGFIYKHNNNKILVLFDSDDGCGGTSVDCKIIKHNLINLYKKYDIYTHLIFKCQHTSLPHFRQFYGFKTNVFPLGLLTNNPQNVHDISNNLPKILQDIDVLCVGSGIRRDIKPIIWPEHRNINEWYPGHRVKIHEKVQLFKNKELKNYNIVLLNERVDVQEFFKLLNRTKIYIEIPGMGLSTRSFCEAL